MIALICPKCGGPLPASAASDAQTTCRFCSVVLCRVAHELEAASGSIPSAPTDRIRLGRPAFEAAIRDGLGEGDPREVLKAALREHLGLESEADVVAAVAWGLAEEFARGHEIDEPHDASRVCRLAAAYISASDTLRDAGTTTLNLPFFFATSAGPIHYTRTLTIADIQALAKGEPAPSASRVTEAQTAAPQKKWWWPF